MTVGSIFPRDEPVSPTSRATNPVAPAAGDTVAGQPGRWIAAMVLLITLVAIYVPFTLQMPAAGLDNSWMVAMNEAVARRMAIGQEVIFTFGPFAGLYTRVYHPAVDRKVVVAGLFVALQCFLCIRRLVTGRRPVALAAIALAFLFFAYSLDALFMVAALLAGLYAWRLAHFPRDERGRHRRATPHEFETALVFAALGLLSLVKVTFVFLDGPMLLLSLGVLAWNGRRRLAAAAAAGFVGGVVAFWLFARQPITALPDYFRTSVDIISGYTDAMSSPGDLGEVVLYWFAAALVLLAIARARALPRSSRFWLAAIVGLILLTASKSGFTRHDYHATIAAAVLLLTSLLLRAAIATPLAGLALVVAGSAAFYFDSVYVHSATTTTLARFALTYRAMWDGVPERLHGSPQLGTRYQQALDALRREQTYPAMQGTTDIYSFDQAHLIASNNRWNPRPIFQSYSVYNPTLAELNRRHLAGSAAPDHVVLRVEPIDGHLPLSEDGPSWPELLSRYQPVSIDGDLLVLDRRNAPAAVAWGPQQTGRHAFGEPVLLPTTTAIVFAKIDLVPTLLGRLVSFLFRIDSPRLAMQMQDGTVRRFRLIPKSAAAGFIASPLVDNVREAVALYSPRALASKRVVSLTVEAPARASPFETLFWSGTFTVESSSLSVAGAVDLASILPTDRMMDESPASDAVVADCLGSIDLVNDLRDHVRLTADMLLKVDGWMDQGSAAIPSREVFITLTDGQGHRRYLSTHATPRPDVGTYLKRPELNDAGYSTTVDLSKLVGQVAIGLAYQSAGQLVRCRQFAIPLTIQH